MQLNLIKTLTIISLSFLFIQCKKDPITPNEKEGKKLGTVELTNAELKTIPYQLNDTIVFADSLGNTKTYYTFFKKSFYKIYLKGGGTDHTSDYYEVEELNVRLMSVDSPNVFTWIHLRAPLPPYVSNVNLGKSYFRLYFNLNNKTTPFYIYCNPTDFDFDSDGNSIAHYNSYTILGNTFNDVYEFYNYGTALSNIEKAFYTRADGIVGFIMDDGTKWYLSN